MSLTKRKTALEVERRRAVRRPTIRSAVISIESECAIFDISEHGAKIFLRGSMILPETFKLSIDSGPTRTCRITWQKNNELGVEFVNSDSDTGVESERVGESRRGKREKIFDKAIIVYNDGFCTMDCQVLDYSEDGAKLKALNPRDCPTYFQLRIKHGPTRNCMVLRRNGYDIGVRFLPD